LRERGILLRDEKPQLGLQDDGPEDDARGTSRRRRLGDARHAPAEEAWRSKARTDGDCWL
jgi:hypothetical protein